MHKPMGERHHLVHFAHFTSRHTQFSRSTMSHLFPNSPNLLLSSVYKQTTKSTKKSKAHRRGQKRSKRSPKSSVDDDKVFIKVGDKTRVKASSLADLSKYKALVEKMKQHARKNAADKEKKKKTLNAKKEKAFSKKESKGMLPEERAYQNSLKLNSRNHAAKAETKATREQVEAALEEKLNGRKKEMEVKKKIIVLHCPLPEEAAYRESIGQHPDAYLNRKLKQLNLNDRTTNR